MRATLIIPMMVLVISNFSAAGGGTQKNQIGRFKFTSAKADDNITIQSDMGKTIFAVRSPSGISQAVIERLDENWPAVVCLRLHLKGLESFKATSAKAKLAAAVSIQDGKPRVRLWKDGQENAALDEKSPLWMAIRILNSDGNPAKELPLKDGYFEMTLPAAFFEGNPKSFAINWIDFHRN